MRTSKRTEKRKDSCEWDIDEKAFKEDCESVDALVDRILDGVDIPDWPKEGDDDLEAMEALLDAEFSILKNIMAIAAEEKEKERESQT